MKNYSGPIQQHNITKCPTAMTSDYIMMPYVIMKECLVES